MSTIKVEDVNGAVQAVIDLANEHASRRSDLPDGAKPLFIPTVLLSALARFTLAQAAAEAAVLAQGDAEATKALAKTYSAALLTSAHDLFNNFIDANAASMAARADLIRRTDAASRQGSVQ